MRRVQNSYVAKLRGADNADASKNRLSCVDTVKTGYHSPLCHCAHVAIQERQTNFRIRSLNVSISHVLCATCVGLP